MEIPLQITFRDMDPSPAVEKRVRAAAGRLERFHARIMSCHVVIEAPHKSGHKGKLYDVRIDLRIPGREIVVNREAGKNHAHEDVYVAIRDAFNAAGRRLEDAARRDRGDVKSHGAPNHGKVVRLFPDDGYGFVLTADGQEIYFHANSVVNDGFAGLSVGDEVRLTVAEAESEKGAQASTVQPVGKHHVL